jgi:hypothetical protein
MPKDGERPEEHHYDFFAEAEDIGGIFVDKQDPVGSYGDEDAIEDLSAEEEVAPLNIMRGADGLPELAPGFDAMAALETGARVSEDELVCLAGDCCHYTECRVEIAENSFATKRYCARLASWAEPMRLDDVDVLACSGHEPKPGIDVDQSRLRRNQARIFQINAAALAAGSNLGVCNAASCQEYVVLHIRNMQSDGELDDGIKRYCCRLKGAARLKEIYSFEPVVACTGVNPGINEDALCRNRIILEQSRAGFAARKGAEHGDGEAGRDTRASDSSGDSDGTASAAGGGGGDGGDGGGGEPGAQAGGQAAGTPPDGPGGAEGAGGGD